MQRSLKLLELLNDQATLARVSSTVIEGINHQLINLAQLITEDPEESKKNPLSIIIILESCEPLTTTSNTSQSTANTSLITEKQSKLNITAKTNDKIIKSSGVSRPSSIEHLSLEIFLEIFSYLPYISLYRAWAGLKSRIDYALRCTHSHVYLSSNADLKDYTEFLQKWAKVVVSFEDHRVPWAASSEVYIDNEPIDIRPLINLQRFFQIYVDTELLKQITIQNFPHLRCLHFGDYSSCTDYSRILFDDPFPFLTSVSGVFLNTTLCNDSSINTIIRRIVISFDFKANSIPLLINFIKRLPNLFTLRVKTYKFEKTSLPSSIITRIRNMSIWLENETTLDEIEFLLQIGPVEQFYLEIGSEKIIGDSAKPCDFVRLAQIINNCQTLKLVQLRVWRLDKQFNIKQIHKLSPWFTTLDLEYGYEERISLQTHRYQFESKHLRF
ncbi:unnamed protein product [Adineta steineri]|uniref:Uncharacterized protein n=1 Tax=Adineta steineri TaxID=433720 RepID=A0A813WFM3_9BILA|nr:unnamed protein product [Adineta steineri]